MNQDNRREVKMVSHRPEWVSLYKEEADKLKRILEKEVNHIYHIGSTSILDIKAKPIIDILVEVKDISKIDNYNEEFQSLDYEIKGEYGITGRRFFTKGGNQRTHHVHVFQSGNHEIKKHLLFRDYLRNYPVEAKKYSDLKEKLAEIYRYDIEKYIEGKDSFIKEIDRKAVIWEEQTNKDKDA